MESFYLLPCSALTLWLLSILLLEEWCGIGVKPWVAQQSLAIKSRRVSNWCCLGNICAIIWKVIELRKKIPPPQRTVYDGVSYHCQVLHPFQTTLGYSYILRTTHRGSSRLFLCWLHLGALMVSWRSFLWLERDTQKKEKILIINNKRNSFPHRHGVMWLYDIKYNVIFTF